MKMRSADDVPDGYTMIGVFPASKDGNVSKLLVTVYAPSRTDLFTLWGPTAIMQRCKEHLEAIEYRSRWVAREFLAIFWDLSEHEPTPEVIINVDIEMCECVGVY